MSDLRIPEPTRPDPGAPENGARLERRERRRQRRVARRSGSAVQPFPPLNDPPGFRSGHPVDPEPLPPQTGNYVKCFPLWSLRRRHQIRGRRRKHDGVWLPPRCQHAPDGLGRASTPHLPSLWLLLARGGCGASREEPEMSGGSYDYLCHIIDTEDARAKIHSLAEMRDRLAGLGYAKDAAMETEGLVLLLRQYDVRVLTAVERLRDVWKAVEWWDSADWGEDSVHRALADYRGETPDESQ